MFTGWCHKCSRRQPVGEFDGDKQTCEKVLRANSAKRMQARLDEAGYDGEGVRPILPRATGPLARAAVAGALGGGAAGGWTGAGGAPGDVGRAPGLRRAAATGASRAQRLDAEEEWRESQLAAKRRQRAGVPRAEASGAAAHFAPPWPGLAAAQPHWMHGGGGGLPAGFGEDPVAAAARSTALAAVASGFRNAGGDRNAALGLAAASLLWTDVAHMQAASVAARAMAAGAGGLVAGASAFAAGGGRQLQPPPPHPAASAQMVQQMMGVMTAFGMPHGGDPFAGVAHRAPPPPQHHPMPQQQPPPMSPEVLQSLHAAIQQLPHAAPQPPAMDEAALASILQPLLANHLATAPNGGAEVAALLAALQHAAQGPPR